MGKEKGEEVLKLWYNSGLRFHCTSCGKCCTGAPGFVWLEDADIKKLSCHLSLSEEEFLHKYTRKVGEKITLLEDRKTYDCIFLQGKQCSVYEARPQQCRAFPFWLSNLKKKTDWLQAKQMCEGIDHADAPLIPLSEILKKLHLDE